MYNNTRYVSSSSSSGGIGFLGLLTITLLVLKVLEYITISWWWVFAPIWIPIALFLIIIAGIMLYGWLKYK